MSANHITRQSLRIPAQPHTVLSARVDGEMYDVVDVNRTGLAILLSKQELFFRMAEDVAVELLLESSSLTLHGRIIHLTPAIQGGFLCGIRFLNLNGSDQVMLDGFLARQRILYFAGHH